MAAAYAERSPDGPDHFGVVAAKGFHLFGIEPELTAAFFAGLPEAQLAIVPGASHGLPMEHPQEVVGLIERFLGSDVPPVTHRDEDGHSLKEVNRRTPRCPAPVDPAPRARRSGAERQTSPMTRTRISQGSVFEEQIGYSRAVVDGRWVFVAGTTGYDYTTMTISDDVVQQARQTLANIDEALSRAGSCAADVVRVHYLLPDAADFEPCWPVLREYFAAALPAATMMVVGLASPAMKIEIEVTALKPDDD